MSNRAYFLGCPTPMGFETHLGDDILSGNFYTYIIKGGPGTGKSTMMKKIAEAISDVDPAELYFCSSDPDSLDAVVFRRLGIILVDGTAPHVFEPVYPGARERILDLGQFFDCEMLRNNAGEITSLCDLNQSYHKRAKRYLGAVQNIGAEIMSCGESAILKDKLSGFAKRLASRSFPKISTKPGKISFKQISSITPKGVMTQDTAFSGCRKYVISDPCYAVTDALLKELASLAAEAGYDVSVSKNVFLPGTVYEHIAVYGLGLAFVSEETAAEEGAPKINALRFYDRDVLRERKKKTLFNRSAKRELTYAAVEALNRAKSIHDDIERCYIKAMDFGRVGELTSELVEVIKSRSKE